MRDLFYSARVNASEPGKAPDLRASDADRDRIAAIIREAAAEGRLGLDEVDERLTAVYSAKTYGQLAEVTADLPDIPQAAPPVQSGRRFEFGATPTSSVGIGILGGFQRRGAWVAPRAFTSVTIMGGGEIDLSEARFAEHDVTVRVVAIMGGVNIIVPEDAEVHVNGLGIMGGFDARAAGPGKPGAPRITITGFAFWGGAGSERKAARAEHKADKHGPHELH